MYRIDDATAATSLPAPEAVGAEGYFTEGDPTNGVPATNVRGSWLNMIQEELRALVVYGGLTPSKTVYTQVRDAIVAKFAKINGDSTQTFSVAPATASQHAAQLGQVLPLTGGTLTGKGALITLADPSGSAGSSVNYSLNGKTTWGLVSDSSGNLGFDRYNNGVLVDVPFWLNNANGVASFSKSPWVPTPAAGDDSNSAASTAFVQGAIASVQGTIKNFRATAPTANAYTFVVSADEVVLENSSNAFITQRNVSLTLNANGTVGAPLSVTSARAASTWYYRWLWYNATNGLTATLDASPTAPTAPTGYTSTDFKCRLPGASRTDSSANTYLLPILTIGNASRYVVTAGSNVTTLPQMASGTTTATWTAVGTSSFVPSTARAIAVTTTAGGSNGSFGVAVAPNNAYSTNWAADVTVPAPIFVYQGVAQAAKIQASGSILLESTNIYWSGQAANTASSLNCLGWEDA